MHYSTICVSREELVCDRGIVAAGTTQEAEAGVEMFKKGGNAVDAAVAAAVCSPATRPALRPRWRCDTIRHPGH